MTKRNNRRSRRAKRSQVGGSNKASMELVQSHRLTAVGDVNFAREDLIDRPPAPALPRTMPRNIRMSTFWYQSQISDVVTATATGSTPCGTSFLLTDLGNAGTIAAFFDQFAIYAVTISYACASVSGALVGNSLLRIATAVDYDGQNFLSPPTTISAISEYNSCNIQVLGVGKSHQRFIKPCVAPALFTGSFTGYGIERMWVDTVSSGVQFYGIQGAIQNDDTSAVNVDRVRTYVVCFRNVA